MKKETIFVISIIIIIAAVIFLIYGLKDNGNQDDKTLKCIANNSMLFVSKTCGHCATQKQMLGDSINLFQIYDIHDNPELANQYEITQIPTWIIDDKKYVGVKSVSQLTELTGC